MSPTQHTDIPESADDPLSANAQTTDGDAHNATMAVVGEGGVELFGAEMPANNYDPKTHIVKAIRIGTVAHSHEGYALECTEDWAKLHADDWTGGKLITNHYGAGSDKHATIKRSWFDGEFVNMELVDMNPETERRMMAGEHTGFSFDAKGLPNKPETAYGTNLSILFYPHSPACSAADGCGLMAESIMKTDGGVEYPASCYLYVPDSQKSSTWKLRVCEMVDGKRETTVAQLGRAAAALSSGGFRGNKVQLPSSEVARIKTKSTN